MSESAPAPSSYQVLARKYRPQTFEDMIGQEPMVRTLTNAFAVGRIAHAFMLTGVRGVGKTTTARLLARAINYEGPHDGPDVKLDPPGVHCEAINASCHMDVMEMDAASRTGVGDIREILDGVRYAPVSARYKIYIIDEVHMLSAAAFNALLKTLEEPPDHAKFIFATTEIRKIPITVLSRCQRFDLRRVAAAELATHLGKICKKEKVSVSGEGLKLIARAAEGSVRDGLSLLDQALVQSDDRKEVDAEQIRSMLGLADRIRVFDLFMLVAGGKAKQALAEIRAQYHDGADPAVLMRDLLDCCHEVSRAKILGREAAFDAAPDHIERLHALAGDISTGQLTRYWQLLLKAHADVRRAPDPLAAAEMAVLGLTLAGKMPPPELAAQLLSELGVAKTAKTAVRSESVGTGEHPAPGGNTKPAPLPDPEPAPWLEINTLEQLVSTLPRGETGLKYDVRKHLRPVHFERGCITFEQNETVPARLATRLSDYLQRATGETWLVVPATDKKGEPSLMEQKKLQEERQRTREHQHPVTVVARELFPGVEIEFRETAPKSNIIKAAFSAKTEKENKT